MSRGLGDVYKRQIDLVRRERRADRGRVWMEDDQWNAIADGREDDDESAAELEKLLQCLSPEDRDLFLRRYGMEQQMDQISAETGMSKDLIYTRISRGKKKIRSLYTKTRGEFHE